MALPKIGLEAIFKTDAFAKGIKDYTTSLKGANTTTTSVAATLGTALGGGLKIAGIAFAALATAAVAAGGVVTGVITKMVFDASTLGDTYSQMSLVTGISTDRLQELAYAGKLLDVELEVITSGMRFLTRNMWTAREGTGETAEAFAELGISVLDSSGNLRDVNEVFNEVIDALGKIKNPTLADAVAMKIMGRSAMELNPLIKAGSKTLKAYSYEAHMMGAVISKDGIEALDLFRDRWDALGVTVKSLKATFATAFLPIFQTVLDKIREFTASRTFQDWFTTMTEKVMLFSERFAKTLEILLGIKAVKLPAIQEAPPTPASGKPGGTTLAPWATEADYEYARKHPETFYVPEGAKPGTELGTAAKPMQVAIVRDETQVRPHGAQAGAGIPEEPVEPYYKFIQAVKDFMAGVSNYPWTELWDSLKAFGDSFIKIPWGQLALDMLKVAKMFTDLMASPMFQWIANELNRTPNPTPLTPTAGQVATVVQAGTVGLGAKITGEQVIESVFGKDWQKNIPDKFKTMGQTTRTSVEKFGGDVDLSALELQDSHKRLGKALGDATLKFKTSSDGAVLNIASTSTSLEGSFGTLSTKIKTASGTTIGDLNTASTNLDISFAGFSKVLKKIGDFLFGWMDVEIYPGRTGGIGAPKARGGYVRPGERAMVGDAPGKITGYEELIHALPGGGVMVYPQRQVVSNNSSSANVSNNIVINNPVPEPASISVNTTLRRLSYLGLV